MDSPTPSRRYGLDFTMHGPDCTDIQMNFFPKVVEPEHLVFSYESGQENDQDQFEETVIFKEQFQKTVLTMRRVFKTKTGRATWSWRRTVPLGGNTQTMNRLKRIFPEEYLKKMN